MLEENPGIKELLRKYSNEQLTPEELQRLKMLVSDMDTDVLDKSILALWNDYVAPEKRNTHNFGKISANLKAIVRPRKERFSLHAVWQIAAAVLLPVLILSTTYLYMDRASIQNAIAGEYRIIAEKGEQASVVLPDGTKVRLNSKSTLTYPASFSVDQRKVSLTGEAYFEVTHDENCPFIVTTSEAKVRVLGTTFNLYAYPGNALFEASLIEGRGEVIPTNKPEHSVMLAPGQKASYYTHTGKIHVSDTDLRVETAWTRGDLIFHSQSFAYILSQLEFFYGVKIQTNGNAPTSLFTGSFHENDVNQVLRNLQQHYKFTFSKLGDEISLTFNK